MMEEDEIERLKEILKSFITKPQKAYKKGWDATRAEQQRQRIIANKPWEKSTGAKTPEGKKIVGQNSRKHGLGHLFTIYADLAEAYYGKEKRKKKKKNVK